jgi:uncharacterized protein (TIGR02186 family)
MGVPARHRGAIAALATCLLTACALLWPAVGQTPPPPAPLPPPTVPLQPVPPPQIAPPTPVAPEVRAPEAPPLPREAVHADVSTRRIAVTSTFSGTGIIVFGAVDNSRQTSAESGLYDVVIVISGAPSRLVARKKSNVGGLWINTSSTTFTSVPSYYAISSTRPLDEVASDDVLKSSGIGFDFVPMTFHRSARNLTADEIREWRDAVVRLKRRDRLYQQDEYGVAFVGRSLFRSAFDMPATVTVGAFETRVYLFRDGELLSTYTTKLDLEREGLEHFVHRFAFDHSFFYGVLTVLIAVGAGMLASYVFNRNKA